MTGKVLALGRAGLSDWIEGVRKYFFKILFISLAFLGLTFALFVAVGSIYLFILLIRMLTEGIAGSALGAYANQCHNISVRGEQGHCDNSLHIHSGFSSRLVFRLDGASRDGR